MPCGKLFYKVWIMGAYFMQIYANYCLKHSMYGIVALKFSNT